jgi:hydrogenase/urease accessory protein HupE
VAEVVVIFRTNGTYQIDVRMDVDALVLGVPPEVPSAQVVAALKAMPPADFEAGVEAAKKVFAKRVRIRFDGNEDEPLFITFPDYGTPLAHPDVPTEPVPDSAQKPPEPTLLGLTGRLVGRIPEGASSFSFGASRAFGPVKLTILDERTAAGIKQLLGPSEDSPPYAFGERPEPFQEIPPSAEQFRSGVWWRYLKLGFTHILPKGLDHILFVVALFLLSTKLRPLLWQVTAFTIAHTVTLALSILNVVSLPPEIVEPLIALSIAYVAIENIFTDQLRPWRPALVFGFGLLHGLGFAGVLRELGLPPGQLVESLLMFNVGVELGQITVIGLAFAAIGWAREREWYRAAIVKPLSLAIGVVGVYWAIERIVHGV